MKSKLFQHKITVKKSPIHGYGVFAEVDLQPEELIEECHALKIREDVRDLEDYLFDCTNESEDWCLLLGYGSIYNHSDQPNAYFFFDDASQLMIFKASRFIPRGEEIFVSYGKTWFDSRSFSRKEISFWLKHREFFSGFLWRASFVTGLLFFLTHLRLLISWASQLPQ